MDEMHVHGAPNWARCAMMKNNVIDLVYCPCIRKTLRWRHNEHDSVSIYQPHDYLLNRVLRRRSKKTSKLRVTGLCAGNSPGTGEFPAQMAINVENVSIWWRHYDIWCKCGHPCRELCNLRVPSVFATAFYDKISQLLDSKQRDLHFELCEDSQSLLSNSKTIRWFVTPVSRLKERSRLGWQVVRDI